MQVAPCYISFTVSISRLAPQLYEYFILLVLFLSRMKRPGAGGPPNIDPNERAKIDEEYMSLMAELGVSLFP